MVDCEKRLLTTACDIKMDSLKLPSWYDFNSQIFPARCRIDGEWVFVKALHVERSPIQNQAGTYKKKIKKKNSQILSRLHAQQTRLMIYQIQSKITFNSVSFIFSHVSSSIILLKSLFQLLILNWYWGIKSSKQSSEGAPSGARSDLGLK